jgi:hypothetical protein
VSSSRSAKRQLEKARQERQAMKRDKKAQKLLPGAVGEGDDDAEVQAPPANQETVLAALAALHEAFENESLDFDEFEAAKAELIGRLRVE